MDSQSTPLVADTPSIRGAMMADVPGIHRLVTHHAEFNRMLFRSYAHLYEHLRDFTVATAAVDGREEVVACVALELVWHNLAEIKSLAVDERFQGRGLGRQLISAKIEEARRLGIERVFALTREREFFEKLQFHAVPRESLPHKVWTDCIHCPLQADCDEIAMLTLLS